MIYEPGCKAFPRNTEIESLLSFTSDRPGRWASSNFPDRGTVTVRQRHSLIALPPDGYRPRAHDPRTGLFFERSYDLSARVEDGYERRMVGGWRLEKKDPGAPLSEPVRPITVYMEAAIPEEYRDAVRDGILYWNRAFRAAGFVDAVRAEVLPPEADPIDVRYPIVVFWAPIRWVAAGQSVSDPRTGEYIKGWVFLTGYKALADLNTYLAIRPALAEGQLSADEFMMARMSWVTAHELGHALIGLYHNDFVLTQIGFPTPLLTVTDDGEIAIDVTPAFPDDPYPYDEWMVRYAYTPFESEAAEAEGLAMIVEEGLRQGLRFVDDYARRSNPRASGRRHNDDVLADLEREVAVRRVLLDHFGPDVLRPGESMSVLFERLIPVYFRHQYALAAVGKAIGGVDYSYALAGDGQVPVRVIDADEQRQAIARLLDALAPEALAIPDGIAELIPPRPRSLRTSEYEWPLSQGGEFEFITGESAPIVISLSAGGVFDPLDWARTLSRLVVRELLSRQRAARVAALHASGLSDLSLIELMERVVDGTWGARLPNDPGLAALGRVARRSVLDRLIAVANDEGTVAEVREAAAWALTQLREDLLERRPDDPAERAHVILALRDLEAFAEPE